MPDSKTLWAIEPLEARTLLAANLVADLSAAGIAPANLTAFGDRVLFTGNTTKEGRELWISDGTGRGTRLVRDIAPGKDSSFIEDFAVVGKYAFFTATVDSQRALWRTDGTGKGTIVLAKLPPEASLNPAPVRISNTLYFANATALWKSDGTVSGTTQVFNFHSVGLAPYRMRAAGGEIYIFVDNEQLSEYPSHHALWRSNGTKSGTHEVAKLALPSTDDEFAAVGDELYTFSDPVGEPGALWRTDSKTGGAVKIHEFEIAGGITDLNGQAFVIASETFSEVDTIWKVSNDKAQQVYADKSELATRGSVNSKLLFTKDENDLWSLDLNGHAEFLTGEDVHKPLANFTIVGNLAYFTVPGESSDALWKTDGTAKGTTKVFDLPPPNTNGNASFAAVGSHIFFPAPDSLGTLELWSTDGTSAGTHIVLDVMGGPESSDPTGLFDLDGTLYFANSEHDASSNLSLCIWKSNGGATPLLLKKFSSSGATSATFFSVGKTALVVVSDNSRSQSELWRIDAKGKLTQIQSELGKVSYFGATADRTMFLSQRAGSNAPGQLWATGGTSDTTVLLRDYNVADQTIFANPQLFQGKLYFTIGQRDAGRLWRTDGTIEHTQRVDSFFAGLDHSPTRVGEFAVFKDKLFFDGFLPTTGWALWRTDGTPEGTGLVKDLWSSDVDGASGITATNNALYFWNTGSGDAANLYRSDGTARGTKLLTQTDGAIMLSGLMAVGNQLYFHGIIPNEYSSYDLWTSDGTASGTVTLPNSFGAKSFIWDGRFHYLSAQAALYRAEGSQSRLLTDFAIDDHLSFAAQITPSEDKLFFVAADDDHGNELRSYTFERSVAGRVFNDTNSNGVRDAGEDGLSGWRVFIDSNRDGNWDVGEPFARTTGSGQFEIDDLLPGSDQLRLTPIAPYAATTSLLYTITIRPGTTVTRAFGVH